MKVPLVLRAALRRVVIFSIWQAKRQRGIAPLTTDREYRGAKKLKPALGFGAPTAKGRAVPYGRRDVFATGHFDKMSRNQPLLTKAGAASDACRRQDRILRR